MNVLNVSLVFARLVTCRNNMRVSSQQSQDTFNHTQSYGSGVCVCVCVVKDYKLMDESENNNKIMCQMKKRC